jgi:hypothetical protein
MAQQGTKDFRRQRGTQRRSGAERDGKGGSLHDAASDAARDGARRLAAANGGKRLQGRGLLRYESLEAESGESAAQRFESGNGSNEAPPRCLGGEGFADGKIGCRNGGDQRVVVELGRR